MTAVETVRHLLSLAVRVDDHFSGEPWPGELDVELDTLEPGVAAPGAGRRRHGDGTYRFVNLTPGARQLTVSAPDGTAFTWAVSVPLVVPLADPTTPIVVEMWPAANARIAPGTLVIRGRLIGAGAGQEVRMEVVGAAPRHRRTRCDADGEFAFVVLGAVELTSDYQIELDVTVPGRTVASIQVLDGDTNPVVTDHVFAVPPGREIRALFNLI